MLLLDQRILFLRMRLSCWRDCRSGDLYQYGGASEIHSPFRKDVMSVALPIVGLPDSLLKKALEKAVEEENYEGASFIRDEMKRRQEEKDEKNLTD